MTLASDREREFQINLDPLAKVIHDTIDALPAHVRLYPDLYALDVAAAVREMRKNLRGRAA